MNANHILQLSGILQQNLGLIPHEIQLKKMSGGAIQENWLVQSEDFALVLRKNAESSVEASSDREQEFLLLDRLYHFGIKVPEPLYFEKSPNFLNSDFFIMKKIDGVTEGHKLVRITEEENVKRLLKTLVGNLL